jgi:hypothetical protein
MRHGGGSIVTGGRWSRNERKDISSTEKCEEEGRR